MVGAPGVVTFLSDYGLDDEFAGVCRGVIARLAPGTRIIDITHGIPRHDVLAGALALAAAVPFMPPAVHLAVVDPGVGSERRSVVIETGSGSPLVGPDNGLLVPAAEALGGTTGAYAIERRDLMLEPVSATFHGRDVFAPVAARLSLGMPPSEVGPRLGAGDLVALDEPSARIAQDRIEAVVLRIDRFGNVGLGARASDLAAIGARPGGVVEVRAGPASRLARCGRTFADVEPAGLVLVEDSSGYLTLAMNLGDAAAALGVRAGSALVIARAQNG